MEVREMLEAMEKESLLVLNEHPLDENARLDIENGKLEFRLFVCGMLFLVVLILLGYNIFYS